ncbi:MAG: hypothetical protein V2J65_04585 [Desulfobacteraceae bacterium]|mgnify:FL=1|nr:hypothetical protein [Desulfobacteraceae bacterium]
MRLKTIVIGVVFSLIIIFPTTIWAAEVRPELSVLSDEEISQRLRFIEQRLDEGRRHANYWQLGWSGFYAVSGAVSGTSAFRTDDGDNRANYIVGTTKSALALTSQLLRPLGARHGADEIRAMPAESRADRLNQLEQAEELLRQNAERAGERTMWRTHLTSLAVNLAGGAAIWAFGDSKDALISVASGIAFSELAIYTQPGRAITDLEDYENKFSGYHSQQRFSWHLFPTKKGAGVGINFSF